MISKIIVDASPAADGDSEAGSPPLTPASLTFFDEHRGLVASVADCNRWLAVAEYGDVFVYAVRAWLPVAAPGAQRMYVLQTLGLVTLTRKRSDLRPHEFAFRAQRTSKPIPEPEAPRSKLSLKPVAIAVDEAAAIDELLPILQRSAKHGRPCPTDAQLADRAGLSRDDVAAALKAMHATGLIRVQGTAAPTLRLITIVATGHRTGYVK